MKTLLTFCILLLGLATHGDERRQPDIVVIMADDAGYSDFGCYGGEIETPVLDKLAANGLRFSQFYNTCLLYTSPSPRDATLSRMPSSA